MKVQINGGLGNQLFQFAYAHRLIKNRQNSKVVLDVEQETLKNPNFQLGKLAEICSHSLCIRESKTSFITKLTHKLPFKIFGLADLLNKSEYRHPDFEYVSDEMPKHAKHFGYFQHWKHVEESWPMIAGEIHQFIENSKSRKNLFSCIKYRQI